MGNQNRITESTPLLKPDGSLASPGWCSRNLYEYNRERISAPNGRIKEWDFYQVSNGEYMVQVNFFNINIASAATAEIQNLKTGEKLASAMSLEMLTVGKNPMSRNGDRPNRFSYMRQGNSLLFDVKENSRRLRFVGKSGGKDFVVELTGKFGSDHESITIATPFKEKGRFFYTNKINCIPTEGVVRIGDKTIRFDSRDTYMVLDWGRGVWPYSNMWYWGNGSTRLPDGKLFGFELTWGFGDESNATETAVFYGGKCHKISAVDLEKDPEKNGWMNDWHFISQDGRFDMTMKPFYDNKSGFMLFGLVGMRCHQVHGLWSGRVVLDDGKVLEINNMYAFCEKVYNKW